MWELADAGTGAAPAAVERLVNTPVRRLVRADVEPALHDRLVALHDRHGVSLAAVVAAAIQAGLPAVERWPAPAGPGGARRTTHPADTHHAER